MDIIGKKYVFLTLSATLLVVSFVAIGLWGLRLGLDFTGGSLLEVEYQNDRPAVEEIKKSLESLSLGTLAVQPTGEKGMILRFKDINESLHQEILTKLGPGAKEFRFDSIGPTIGRELKQKSIMALGFAVLAIILYIAWAFRKVSKPVSSWKYGITAVIALVHDVSIPTGVFALLGHVRGVEIDPLFITALLTILGFSVHDTIVVFDRTRENLHKLKAMEPFEVTVNRSVNETLSRSINTSFTVLLVLLAIFFLGGETTRYFSLALMLGIIFGTYSSIFVASPLLVIWQKFSLKKRN
ncbi:MAG: protein translocase subunit SecF [Candidatus Sungiibacteriota bacterium]|uniref:Protein-export membrane protein SecF n=1 Tax=Candidatus Sungiibacteriota bacterium TaxID=2750080 RepID=A0A7T5RJN7_9BACT|nr:MAG: protein translocase subunit SecF [Candidatus Sungbacteria bacterium]